MASFQSDFIDFLGLSTQPPVGGAPDRKAQARTLAPVGEVLRQILGHKRGRLRQLGKFCARFWAQARTLAPVGLFTDTNLNFI